ncbi:hypothetical protein GCM10011390_22560 [Aureimonas endophytica]|uniref:Protein kinase domain-containing protein n=1 Tax=Aureimonas endophytica TaxID=2027858 RepID=A0A917E4C4_9HYPH|nr:protein kinase [Aureimonas endophytica]GGE03190.1 hypothetical protein GCM10011390_22560 [Aureimonas endophytica]
MLLPSYVGRYAVRHEIARGGFAVVVLAWDEELDCAVALKLLAPFDGGGGEAMQERFVKEARLLRRIRSHHVVTVHDVGHLADGRAYFVMDFADRGTLEDWLGRQPPSPAQGTSTVAAHALGPLVDALAEGLGAVHRAGIVHRDIKPANILLQSTFPYGAPSETAANGPQAAPGAAELFRRSRILVGDFGIAKDLAYGDPGATLVGGTPAYQAPEQLDPDRPVTAAADIYSATAVLYRLIAGARPVRAERMAEAISRLPERWHEFMRRGLALDPADRFDSVEAWRAEASDVLAAAAADGTATWGAAPNAAAAVDCPYKGLNAYQPEDGDRFFGREALVEDVVRRMRMRNVLVVGGASGSGKSSLVRAGLLPALRSGALPDSAIWRFALMTPGRDAMAELYFQLAQSLSPASPVIDTATFAARPGLARRLAHPAGTEAPLLLCIDQFEELFTLSPPGQRDAFVAALSAMTDPADSRVRIVLTVRADFYAACARMPWIAECISQNQVLVGPMNSAELRRAIGEPARRANLHLERNLVDAIVEEAGQEDGSLPLVAHALVETWARRKGATLTLEGYRAAGGVAGAIAQTAGAIYDSRFNDSERDAARQLFLQLVTPGEGAGDTRRIVDRGELVDGAGSETTANVIEQMTNARLLTVDERSVQIAHEALLRSWPRLRQWIDEARDDLRMRQRVIRHAEEWEAAGGDPDLLLRGTSLLAAGDWQSRNPHQGSATTRAFIDASLTEKLGAEAAEQQRLSRFRRLRIAAVAMLSVLTAGACVASVAAYLGYREAHLNEQKAAAATRQSEARFATALGAISAGLAREDPRLALFLAGEAVLRAGDDPPGFDARVAMIAARQQLSDETPQPLGSPVSVGDALSIAMSPNGRLLAVGGRDGTVRMIDTGTRQFAGTSYAAHEGGIEHLEFSPDGRLLATIGNDAAVRTWALRDNGSIEPAAAAAKLGDVGWSVAFDPTGNWLATASEDQTVRLWNARGGADGTLLVKGGYDPRSLAFSPDGRSIVVGTATGAIDRWSIERRERSMPTIRDVHTSDIWDIRFSPTARYFASSSSDGSAALFTYPEGRYLRRAFEPGTLIHSIAFTRTGENLIGGGEDGRLHVWNLIAGSTTSISGIGHIGRIIHLAISGDGLLLASLGRDQTVRFWTLSAPIPMTLDRSTRAPAKGVAISSDGQLVAAGDAAGMVYVWRRDEAVPRLFDGHRQQVWAVAIAPDGRTLASGDRSGEVRIWDLQGRTLAMSRPGRPGAVWWLGFTPDGKRLIEAGDAGIDVLDIAANTTTELGRSEDVAMTRGAVSPDGTRLAISTIDGRVRLFDLTGNRFIRDLDVLHDIAWSVAWSADGRLLAVGSSDEVVSLWDPVTGEQKASLAGHSGGAVDIGFMADDATLAVVDRRGSLHFWDVATQRRLSPPIPGHAGTSWRLGVARQQDRVVTAGEDGKVRTWDVMSPVRACRIGETVFDTERKREYFGGGVHILSCSSNKE